MKKLSSLLLLFCLFGLQPLWAQDARYFEMRTYTIHPGKKEALIQRFQNHTLRILEKNGIENVAYFLPTDPSSNSLTFILAYPSQESRDRLWNDFVSDPEWQEAQKSSEANGPLVAKVDQTFMVIADELSSGLLKDASANERIFELRTYTMHVGKVPAINARFRDYTRELFQKHGMTNIIYWYTVEKDGSQPKLVYLLAHKTEKAAKASFDKFGKDPVWTMVRDASERNGPIVQKITSVYLKALPFSPLR